MDSPHLPATPDKWRSSTRRAGRGSAPRLHSRTHGDVQSPPGISKAQEVADDEDGEGGLDHTDIDLSAFARALIAAAIEIHGRPE